VRDARVLLEGSEGNNARMRRAELGASAARSLCGGLGSRGLRSVSGAPRARALVTVLGVESSCDDTGVGVVRSDGAVLSNVVASQFAVHAEFGGVVPRLAARAHAVNLPSVVEAALREAGALAPGGGIRAGSIDAVAVTVGPGLAPCLRAGVKVAVELAAQHGLPLLPVHHMEGHALTARLHPESHAAFPFLALLVSGGHSLLLLARGVSDYVELGCSVDDAVGETFDKVARLLELDASREPAGRLIERLALAGDPARAVFPVPMLRRVGRPDMSFAGIKSAVSRWVDHHRRVQAEAQAQMTLVQVKAQEQRHAQAGGATLDEQTKADVAAGFQLAAVSHIVNATRRALSLSGMRLLKPNTQPRALVRQARLDIEREDNVHALHELLRSGAPPTALVLAGGVAANTALRSALQTLCDAYGLPLKAPPPQLCTDNGVMIAWAALERIAAQPQILSEEPPAITAQRDAEAVARELTRARWKLAAH
jgi:N6-L-threonylcarbamoyladenine synthase